MIFILFLGTVLVVFGLWNKGKFFLYFPYGKVEIEVVECNIIHEQEYGFAPFDFYTLSADIRYSVSGVKYRSKKIGYAGAGRFSSEIKANEVRERVLNSKECYFSLRRPSFGYVIKSDSVGDRDGRSGFLGSGLIVIAVYLVFNFFGL
tara:strand:- start:78 stop:521 length:444 start_codon:yes stop_codon:yes gene_type:complete